MDITEPTIDEKLVVKRKELELSQIELALIKTRILVKQAQQELFKLENP